MKVGIPREIKNNEYRVAISPAGVRELTARGHDVLLESGAGLGSAFPDADFKSAGAQIAPTADDVWAEAELVLKVKEPIAEEYSRLRRDQTLFTYLHLAASRDCTDALLRAGTTAIAYETVTGPDSSLPLLAPMSEVAGRLAPQVGAYHLMRSSGGRGMLLGGVPGVRPASVVVIGAGVAGRSAVAMAHGLQADVTVLDVSLPRLRELDEHYHGRVKTLFSTELDLESAILEADLVIGAVLVPGAKAPELVSDAMVQRMKPGSVLVDIAIDQGGCFAGSRPTTHAEPTFPVHESLFYCVANMPGAVPRTSTFALINATLPYVLALADRGWRDATDAHPGLAAGLSTHHGKLLSPAVAEAHGYPVAVP